MLVIKLRSMCLGSKHVTLTKQSPLKFPRAHSENCYLHNLFLKTKSLSMVQADLEFPTHSPSSFLHLLSAWVTVVYLQAQCMHC